MVLALPVLQNNFLQKQWFYTIPVPGDRMNDESKEIQVISQITLRSSKKK